MGIRKKGNRWYVEKMIDGRRIYENFAERTRAVTYLKKLEVDRDLGKLGLSVLDQVLTVETAGESWLEFVEQNRAATTYASYRCRWFANILPELGERLVAELRPADVEELVSRRLRAGATPNDVAHDRMMLGAFFTWAVRNEHATENPVRKTEKMKYAPLRRRRALTPDEVEACSKVLRPESHLAFLVSVYTGVRKSELVRIAWDDVDLEAEQLHVSSIGRAHTKNYDARNIPLHPKLLELLRGWPRRRKKLIGTTKGERRGNDFRGIVEQCVIRAKVKPFVWHDLRHTFGTWLRKQGVPLEDIAVLMGHRDLKSALIYAHEDDENLRAGVRRLP